MILVKKVFIFSKTMIICLLCPLLCGLFFFWKGAKGELSYKAKKITPSQILAVGDSGNDLSMLSLDLGVTAAMANASATVKDVCSVIAPSNDQDGVAFLIEDILEQNELAARVRRSFCLALDYSKI